MKKLVLSVCLILCLILSATCVNVYAGYVSGTNTPLYSDATKTYVYVSTSTKSSKGTVVIMHGMILVVPDIYQTLIDTLTGMGYDVIFPQYQEAGMAIIESMGVLALLGGSSPSHIQWTQHAIDGINWALTAYVGYWYNWYTPVFRKPSTNLYIFAHSVGGAIGYNIPLMSSDLKSKIKGIVLANAVYDPSAINTGAPMPSIQLINIAAAGAQINVPLLYLTGNQDAWATSQQAAYFMNNAATTNKKMLTAISSDANHMAPATNQGTLMDILSWAGLTQSMLGGDAVWNAMDTNYYLPAILHLINGNPATTFNPSVAWQ